MKETTPRVLHCSTWDGKNGAGKAAFRLHEALRGAGMPSKMVVREAETGDQDVFAARNLGPWLRLSRRLRHRLTPGPDLSARAHLFNLDVEPDLDFASILERGAGWADVLVLHVVTRLLSVSRAGELARTLGVPAIRVLMDMEPLTGGCHHPLDCTGYRRACGDCFQLASPSNHDWSYRTFERKRCLQASQPHTFVAPTTWLADRVRESAAFGQSRVEVIPLALDTETLRPLPKETARAVLSLPPDADIIFFGAYSIDDERKGLVYLREALGRLAAQPGTDAGTKPARELLLLIAGRREGSGGEWPFEVRYTGWIRDELRLALAYQAADVLACPSVYDAGPMMIPEAMLCGTPVVAFRTGGAPDLIEHRRNGYLAAYKDATDLCEGIRFVLRMGKTEEVRQACHQAAKERHDPATVAAAYGTLVRSLLHTASMPQEGSVS